MKAESLDATICPAFRPPNKMSILHCLPHLPLLKKQEGDLGGELNSKPQENEYSCYRALPKNVWLQPFRISFCHNSSRWQATASVSLPFQTPAFRIKWFLLQAFSISVMACTRQGYSMQKKQKQKTWHKQYNVVAMNCVQICLHFSFSFSWKRISFGHIWRRCTHLFLQRQVIRITVLSTGQMM